MYVAQPFKVEYAQEEVHHSIGGSLIDTYISVNVTPEVAQQLHSKDSSHLQHIYVY